MSISKIFNDDSQLHLASSKEELDASPDGWVSVTLRETADVVRGVSFPKGVRKLEMQTGYVACLRTANVQREVDWRDLWFVPKEYVKVESRYVQLSDVLISVSNSLELVGKVAYVTNLPQKSTLGAFISLLRFSSSLDAKFYYYQMASPDVQAEIRYSASTTTNISNISSSKLSEITLNVPPLPEQHRIVAEIEKQFTRLDASVAALKRVQANLKRYRAGVLKAACEGKLVPTEAELAQAEGRAYEPADRLLERILAERRTRWETQENRRGKYKEPVAPDTSNLPELPEGWVWAGLDQLAPVVRNGYSKPPRGDIGTPILRISAVRPLSVDLQDIRWVDSKDDLAGFLIHPGDLLFTRYNGNTELVGVCGVVPVLERDTLHPDKLIRACLTENGAVPNFVQIVANSGVSRRFLARRIRTTAGQSGISGSDLKSMPIPLPPLAEQRRIVAEVERRLSVIQQADAMVEANLTRAERLRQSILKQAFAGKLVPQYPTDEPASALLERIRAEREAAEAAAKAQRKPRRRGSKSTQTTTPKLSEVAR